MTCWTAELSNNSQINTRFIIIEILWMEGTWIELDWIIFGGQRSLKNNN